MTFIQQELIKKQEKIVENLNKHMERHKLGSIVIFHSNFLNLNSRKWQNRQYNAQTATGRGEKRRA